MRVGGGATESSPGPEASGGGLPVRVVRRWLASGERETAHHHAFVELCHVESGRGVLFRDARGALAAAHTVSIVPPGAVHALAADSGWACGANLVHFDPDVLAGGESEEALAGLFRLAAADHGAISLRATAGQATTLQIGRVGTLSRRAEPTAQRACRQMLGELCQRLWRLARDARVVAPVTSSPVRRPATASPPPAASRPEIEHVLDYIERNLTRPISRQDLARQAAFAPSYFSALFREATGTTIPEYINARRVVRAQDLLRDPDTRVSAVCYAVGFRDLSNFNRVFKRLVGQTPREYRRAALGDACDDDADEDPGGRVASGRG